MNLLVIIDSNNQDQSLGVEIKRVMEGLLWSSFEGFPYVFTKIVDNEDIDDLISGIHDDIHSASDHAEWQNVKYLYKIGGSDPIVAG